MSASYLPSFFEVNIPTTEPLNDLLKIEPKIQGLYAHEYVHFLQNLTTNFGLLKTWNRFDRIAQIIEEVQRAGEDIQLPLTGEVADNEQNNMRLLQSLEGSGFREVPERESHDYAIGEIELHPDPLLDATFQVDYLRHIVLKLRHDTLPTVDYVFGETAIAETMAYIIESKFYDIQVPAKWPYFAGEALASRIFAPVAVDKEQLLALCDISLMHPAPGWAFYSILQELAASPAPPASAEALIDFAMIFYAKRGWNIDKQLESARDGLMAKIQTLFSDSFFAPTKTWFQSLVYRGADLRDKHYMFILDVYRSQNLLKEGLANIVANLGGPHTINIIGDRYLIAPLDINISAEDIHPQKLRALDQIHDMLLKPAEQYRCKLLDICRDSQPADLVDKRCRDKPWERVREERLCPFAVLWNYYTLDQKKFYFKGQRIYETPTP